MTYAMYMARRDAEHEVKYALRYAEKAYKKYGYLPTKEKEQLEKAKKNLQNSKI